MNLLQTWRLALNGKLQLWRVFWIGHFLAYFIISVVYALFVIATNSPLVEFLFLPTLLIYMALVYVAMWKCAMNVEKKMWGYCAKIYAGFALATYVIGIITIPIALLTR